MVSLPFQLVTGYVPQVKVGDKVKIGTILAKKTANGYKHIILPEALSVKPHSVGKFLKVGPGDSVKEGDTLAVKKSIFREDKVMSEVSGTVIAFERDSGELLIQEAGEKLVSKTDEIRSPIDGEVVLCDNGQIVIETEKDVLLGEHGVGEKAEGSVLKIDFDPEKKNSSLLYSLDASVEGKILLLTVCDRDTLLKAIGMDAKGIITSEINESDLSYLVQRNITTPVIHLSEPEYKKMIKWAAKEVYMDGIGKTVLLLHV